MEITQVATAPPTNSSVEFHTTAEQPTWSVSQRCSCGERFPSKTDLYKHQAEGRLISLESLMGIERVVVAPFERRWTEDNDGVWHLGYYDGADLVTQSALCVELVTLYEGTQIQHSGWYATSDPLTEEGFFGPRFATPDNAKMLVEAFDNALSRLDPATSGGPVAVAGPGVLLMRSMVEDASGSVEEARRWNKDQRLCVACGAELAADTCQNMVCPVGLAFVATNSPEDLEDL